MPCFLRWAHGRNSLEQPAFLHVHIQPSGSGILICGCEISSQNPWRLTKDKEPSKTGGVGVSCRGTRKCRVNKRGLLWLQPPDPGSWGSGAGQGAGQELAGASALTPTDPRAGQPCPGPGFHWSVISSLGFA